MVDTRLIQARGCLRCAFCDFFGIKAKPFLQSQCNHVEYLLVCGNAHCTLAGCYFPLGSVEAVLFTEHFAGCYFPHGFRVEKSSDTAGAYCALALV